MSVEGRIVVDALFHDKAGTSAVNVVSITSAKSYLSGKVAIVTGTVAGSTLQHFIPVAPSTYRDSNGSFVSFSEINHIVAKASDALLTVYAPNVSVMLRPEDAPASVPVVFRTEDDDSIWIESDAGSCSYTILMYGS